MCSCMGTPPPVVMTQNTFVLVCWCRCKPQTRKHQTLRTATHASHPRQTRRLHWCWTSMSSADGSMTDWHFDWTEARNVALGVEDWPPPQADAVAAFWYFVCPQYMSVFMDHLQEIEVHGGRTWQETDYAGFVKKYPGAMLCLKQKLQDEVYVPPGWLHAVFTKLPCVKLAWDFFAVDNAALYMAAWRHVGAPFAQKRGSLNSKDFMYAGDAVVQASTNAA
ncbi:hypothetical protein DUNSADRAFT_330 [Dunaliella salina]|uniref:JmjC domain-containing protein n=1 Tax=Dunaliella salina TaxID=3046 RepID=A0ABQ7FZ61_DUNSA|nr:hypothetical protein DUNSADRAFT_330 [Dunaliella salina]|eukprot:KAF5827636.1 hypothetical protein DUNSADRAFT_330 [Dunaliella salina]